MFTNFIIITMVIIVIIIFYYCVFPFEVYRIIPGCRLCLFVSLFLHATDFIPIPIWQIFNFISKHLCHIYRSFFLSDTHLSLEKKKKPCFHSCLRDMFCSYISKTEHIICSFISWFPLPQPDTSTLSVCSGFINFPSDLFTYAASSRSHSPHN